MQAIIKGVLIALIATVAVGCASTPRSSDYLFNYEQLTQGEHIERYWVKPDVIAEGRSYSLSLGEVIPYHVYDSTGVTVDQAMQWLREGLAENGLHEVENAELRVDIALSEMYPGSRSARIWAGEFGAGHAFVQVEGRVIRISTGEVIAAFAERRRSSGAAGLRDIGSDSGPVLVQEMITEISRDAVRELRGTFGD